MATGREDNAQLTQYLSYFPIPEMAHLPLLMPGRRDQPTRVNSDLGRGLTPLGLGSATPEILGLLLDHGADIEASDYFGDRPLHHRCRRYGKGDPVRYLLTRGADPNARNAVGRTAVHRAASELAAEPLRELARHDAHLDPTDAFGITPFSLALRTASSTEANRLLAIVRIFLSGNVTIPDDAAWHIDRIGQDFSTRHLSLKEARRQESSDALEELYGIFGVEPIPLASEPRPTRDSMDRSKVYAAFRDIWSQSVPYAGPSDDLRVEAIRTVGRIGNEILNNGAINWDIDFERMLTATLVYFSVGTPLPPDSSPYAPNPMAEALEGGRFSPEEIDHLTRHAVEWHQMNAVAIDVPSLPYAR